MWWHHKVPYKVPNSNSLKIYLCQLLVPVGDKDDGTLPYRKKDYIYIFINVYEVPGCHSSRRTRTPSRPSSKKQFTLTPPELSGVSSSKRRPTRIISLNRYNSLSKTETSDTIKRVCVHISEPFRSVRLQKNAIRCHGNASLISLVRHGDISVVRKKSIFDSTPTTKDSVVERLHFHSVTIPPIHQFLGFP